MSFPTYSARFLSPFAQLLASYENYPAKSLDALRAIDPDARIPMREAHDLAVAQVAATGDADLGLKAARLMSFGRGGALAFAMHTAATVRESLEVGARYARLYCDGASMDLDVQGKRAMVRFNSSVPLPRPVSDFAMSTWYTNHVRGPIGEGPPIECWLASGRPRDTTEYERTFTKASLRFASPFDAFVFPTECLDVSLASADSSVHALLRGQLVVESEQLASRRTFAAWVHEIAARELSLGNPSASTVARAMRMSVRTLARRLEGEGTSFSSILDQLRQELALRYVGRGNMPIAELASRLRFSHPEAFNRAFKRWTGVTPHAYRRAHGPG